MSITPSELRENFSFLTDWEDKYRYLIELGDSLPLFPESDKTKDNKVEGCMSQVWFIYQKQGDKYFFNATSDAHIVRGLEAVLLAFINGQSAHTIQQLDLEGEFRSLGLDEHLSPTRRNGFFAMVNRIREIVNR